MKSIFTRLGLGVIVIVTAILAWALLTVLIGVCAGSAMPCPYRPFSGCVPFATLGWRTGRAAIAEVLINSPKIPVEDEPAGDLDVVSVQTIITLLKKSIRKE